MYLCRVGSPQTMISKRHIFLIIFTLGTLACAAQGRLVFAPTVWDFGTIAEAKGAVSHSFTAVNQGDKPVVILDAVTSCGCTYPEFSRKPILPGEKTQVKVTFDPANRPGVFEKGIDIYSADRRKIATLTVRGNVTAREKTLDELYPVDAGGGLRLAATLCAFSYIYQGQTAQSSIGYANTSKKSIRLYLRMEERSGCLTVTAPREIAPGERGEIEFAYAIPAGKPRYGTLRDLFAVEVDGRASGTVLAAHAIGIDRLDASGRKPKAEITENIIKFGAVKHTSGVQKHLFAIKNAGDTELIVRAVEIDGEFETTLKAGQKIAAGRSAEFSVTLDPAKQEYGSTTGFVTVITNDLTRPMRKIRVTAIIEAE